MNQTEIKELYLVRHGEAVSKSEDPARPLSPKGRAAVERVAQAAAAAGVRVERIVQSGKLRASQTAQALAGALEPRAGVYESADLVPNADPDRARALVEAEEGTLMLVGHLPHLERLTSLLLAGDPDKRLVSLETGTLVRLLQVDGVWCLGALVPPRVLSER